MNLGNSYDQLRRPIEALDSYERAVGIAPNFAMAMANRGLALLDLARYAGAHRPAVLTESYWQIFDALTHEEEIIEYGGPGAVTHFTEALARWETFPTTRLPEPGRLSDAFGAWCQSRGLLLHPSERCIDEHRDTWDVLYFHSVTEDIQVARGDGRPPDVFAAFNVLKSEFVTARFLAWMAFNETPASEVLAEASGRTAYIDTLDYALYDLGTGLARSAFQTGANLLDKIAVTASLYLGLGREASAIGFRGWWADDRKRNAALAHPKFRAAIERGGDGFLGMADLSADFEDGGRYADLQALRNAATHRNVVVHDGSFAADTAGFAGSVVHVMLDELEELTLDQLKVARAALFYLAHGIDGLEAHRERLGRTAPLPTFPYLHR